MTSINQKEMESLKQKCAVSSAVRIPEMKSVAKENVNPAIDEMMIKSILHAADSSAKNSSFFRESNRKRPTITAQTFLEPKPIKQSPKKLDDNAIQELISTELVLSSDDQPVIDHDETGSQDTVVGPADQDLCHQDIFEEKILPDFSHSFENMGFLESDEATSKVTANEKLFDSVMDLQNQESLIVNNLPPIFQSENPFVSDIKDEIGINTNEESEAVENVCKILESANTKRVDGDILLKGSHGTLEIKSKDSSLYNSPKAAKISFQLPEWKNQDFSELWGFIGDEDQKTCTKVQLADVYKVTDESSDLKSNSNTKVIKECVTSHNINDQKQNSVNDIDVYIKFEPVDFHLNLTTSSSLDGLSKIANEWEGFQNENLQSNDDSASEIKYISVNNLFAESKPAKPLVNIEAKANILIDNQLMDYKLIKNLSKDQKSKEDNMNIGERVTSTDSAAEIVSLISPAAKASIEDQKKGKFSIFDQKLQVLSHKLDVSLDKQTDLGSLKSKIETKSLVIDTGRFERREEPKFVQLPKNEFSRAHNSSTHQSNANLKKVTFGAAWKGELECIKYVHHDSGNVSYFPGAKGILIFEVNEISNLSGSRSDRNYQIEIHHKSQKEVSQIVFLPQTQTKTFVGFESKLSLNGLTEIQFRLVEIREEKLGVKQSIINLFSTIGRKKGKLISNSFSLYNMKDSKGSIERKGSILSLNSISQTFNTVGCAKLESSIICSSPGQIKEDMINLKSDKKVMGKMTVRYIYVPYYSKPNLRDSLLPSSLSEVEHAFILLNLHKKVYKKGHMYQLGGDTTKWTKRYYELHGMHLYIFSSKGSKVAEKLDLTQLWTAQILCKPLHVEYKNRKLQLEIIELEFKDGVIISLGTKSSDKGDRDEWMRSMEEVDKKLSGDPIPDWILNLLPSHSV